MAAVVKALKLVAKGIKAARAKTPSKVFVTSKGIRIVKGKKLGAPPRKRKEYQSNDGQGNIRYSHKLGHQPKRLGKLLESKIRDALNPASVHVIQNSGNTSVPNGQCYYTNFEMMNTEDMDQLIGIANTAGQSTSGAPQDYNGKVNIQNAKLQLTLRNQTTNLVNMTIYEYICRRDLPDEIEQSPGSVAPEVPGTTANAIIHGFNYQAAGAQIQANSLGGTLFQNPLFCTYYKITKVKRVQLGAGKVLNMSLSNLKARVINPLIYNNKDGDVLAGLTRGFVIQASGSLVGPAENAQGQPTTGFVNYDWYCSRKYAYNQPWSGSGRNTFASNLPETVVPWQHINEYTGQPQDEEEA